MADRRVVMELGAKVKGTFGAALDSIRGKIKGIGGAWDSIWKLGASYSGLKSMATDLKNFAFSTANAGAEINDLSIKTGISTETLSKLKYAAGLADLGIGDAADGFRKMNLAMAKAGKGSADVAYAFHEVGISMSDMKNLSQEEIFARAGEGLLKIESSSKRAAVGNAIFGKSFSSLMPMFATLRADMQDAEKRTTIWSQVSAAAADKFGDNWTAVSNVSGKIIDAFFNGLIPAVNDLSDSILSMTDQNAKLLAQDLMSWGKKAGETFTTFAGIINDIVANGSFGVWWANLKLYIAEANIPLAVLIASFKKLVAVFMEVQVVGATTKGYLDKLMDNPLVKYNPATAAIAGAYNFGLSQEKANGKNGAMEYANKVSPWVSEIWQSANNTSNSALQGYALAKNDVEIAKRLQEAERLDRYRKANSVSTGENVGKTVASAVQKSQDEMKTGVINGFKTTLGSRESTELANTSAAGVGP